MSTVAPDTVVHSRHCHWLADGTGRTPCNCYATKTDAQVSTVTKLSSLPWTGRAHFTADRLPLFALRRFRAQHGRAWKAKIRTEWMHGRCPVVDGEPSVELYALRNTHGTEWLSRFRLPPGVGDAVETEGREDAHDLSRLSESEPYEPGDEWSRGDGGEW